MAAWITHADVGALVHLDLSEDEWIEATIAHAQGLAELEIGEHDDPSQGLKSTLAQIVARMWQAGESARTNRPANTGGQAGPFAFQNPHAGAAGLGLTEREKKQLRKAVGKGSLFTQPTTRGDQLATPGRRSSGVSDPLDPIDQLASAQAGVRPPGGRRRR